MKTNRETLITARNKLRELLDKHRQEHIGQRMFYPCYMCDDLTKELARIELLLPPRFIATLNEDGSIRELTAA